MSKAHKLHRLAMEKIYNKPLLIVQESLAPIIEYLENRETSLTATEAAILSDNSRRYSQSGIAETIGFVPIYGSLAYEKSWLDALCSITSYQQLLEDVEMLIDQGAKTIVLDQNSGGGECYGCFETARAIRERADSAGVKLIAYIDGMSASASYALSSVAHEIISNPSSSAGSIGVLIRLLDQSEAMKKAGYSQIFLTSAKSKVPFDSDGKFKQDFLDGLQAEVDELHKDFVSHVATYRGLNEQVINNLEAKVFNAKEALSLGLIDKIMTHDDFAEYLATIEDETKPMPINFFNRKAKAQAEVEQPNAALAAQQEELEMADKALLEGMQAKLDALQAQYDTDVIEAVAALEEKDAELNAALKELADAKEALAAIEADKAQAALDAKKAKLEAVVGTEMAGDLFPALSALDDSAFDKVVASYEAANKKFDQSPLAQEVGYEADGTASAEQKESALARRLKAKQAKQ